MNRILTSIAVFVTGASLTTASAQTAARDTVVGIYFAHDHYGLSKEKESIKLNNVARYLKRDTTKGHVTLNGYASNSGTEQYNRRLVARRLETVKKALIKRGVEENRIHPIINNSIDRQSIARYARRVDLSYTLLPDKQPVSPLASDTLTAVPAVPLSDAFVADNPVTVNIAPDMPAPNSTTADGVADSSLFTLHSSLKNSCPRLALRTNLLYDLVLVPNVGAEWFASDHWSVAANVMFMWLKNDTRHRYWRILSTDVEGRYWLKPQTCDVRTGHHFGLYAGFYRYDFEFGGRGYMGDANYGGGISYGYALRLFPSWKERFTLDMSIGLGYLGGNHKEYIPDAGCYVWQRTMSHHFFIPTKAEISLVWYPRSSFFNKKGGAQ